MKSRCPAVCSLVVAAALLSSAAQADCAQAIAGFRKAQQQPRIAVVGVSDKNEQPTGDPLTLRIGDSVYVNGAFDGLKPGFVKDSGTMFPHTTDLQSTQKRTVVCTDLSADQYRGKPAIKVHVKRSDRDKGNVLWFDRASGLPVYQEDDEKMFSLAFVYGDAVKDPAVSRH